MIQRHDGASYDAEITALLVIDPYNDSISTDGMGWSVYLRRFALIVAVPKITLMGEYPYLTTRDLARNEDILLCVAMVAVPGGTNENHAMRTSTIYFLRYIGGLRFYDSCIAGNGVTNVEF